MTREDIYKAIPHRPPFLFIDEIEEWTAKEIVCKYTFKESEFFFQGHYPGNPIVPGVILCESGLQAGAILLSRLFRESESGRGMVPVVVKIEEIRFRQIIRPGETITLRVAFKERLANAYFLVAKIEKDGKAVTRFEFSCTGTAG